MVEKFKRSGAMGPHEMNDQYDALYAHLLATAHAALAALSDVAPKPPLPPVPGPPQLERLSELAAECEAVGTPAALRRAEALHQRRLLAAHSADVWVDYGSFLLRRGPGRVRGRAEEALREAVALDGRHVGGLAALAALLLHKVRGCVWCVCGRGGGKGPGNLAGEGVGIVHGGDC